MARTRILAGLAIATVALAASACGGGGGGKSPTTTTSGSVGTSTVQWADGVCSAFSTWKTSLQTITTNFRSNPTAERLKDAARQVKRATNMLTRSLQALHTPNTSAARRAKTKLDALAQVLSDGIDSIETTLQSSTTGIEQVTKITAQLTTMSHALTRTVGSLKENASTFTGAPSCHALFA